MTNTVKEKQLLPKGFVDQLPPEADREAAAISILGTLFRGFGYRRIKPPLVEFEESLFAPGPGASLPQKTFRMLDPQSYKMMGVRSDITPQIARIATSRLSDFERPLRITYANDVLRTAANQHRTARQFCKVGCEIIGTQDIQADFELCMLAVIGLKKLGLTNITLDLTLPRLLDHVLPGEEQTEDLTESIQNRDTARIQSLLGYSSVAVFLNSLIQSGGDTDKNLGLLRDLVVHETAARDIEMISELIELLKNAFSDLEYDDIQITLDPLETNGFEYHHGIAFSLFAQDQHGELGRGGRYMLGNDENGEHACGFTLYMDSIGRAMADDFITAPKPETVEKDASWRNLLEKADKGKIVARAIK